MANDGVKKTAKANATYLHNHLIAFGVVEAVHMLLSFAYFGVNWATLFLYPALYFAGYSMVRSRSKPVIDDQGRPVVVADIKTEPYCQYTFDVLYITAAVQLLSLLSRWAYALFAVIPVYAGFKLVSLYKQYSSMTSAMGQKQQDGGDSGKQKRPRMKILRR